MWNGLSTRVLGARISAFGVRLEVSDADDVERAVEQVAAEFGEIDVLLSNAGISGRSGVRRTRPRWREVMATNVDGVCYCSRAVGRRMRERGGGTIVNIGSMSAEIVNQPRWQVSYLSSKAAVHQMTKALAAEWAPTESGSTP
jgi:NAD(P)-dependent dehydrogenase (short-subunit alcohol dehydrogenase family)